MHKEREARTELESVSSLEEAMMDSLVAPELKELNTILAETALDSVIEIGQGIPFVGLAVQAWKSAKGIQEALYIKNIYRFLIELQKIDLDARKKFLDSLRKNQDEYRRTGETLLLILSRVDALEKPALIGKIFRAHIEKLLSFDDTLRLMSMVERVYMADLRRLLELYPNETYRLDDYTKENLANVGLMSFLGVTERCISRLSFGDVP